MSVGVDGLTGTRNAPSLTNTAYNASYFWDGGVPTLEQQVIVPMTNPREMDMTMALAVDRIASDSQYVQMFRAAYDTLPSPGTLTRAIAAFERTFLSGNSRYDRYNRGDESALNESEKRGMTLFFNERGDCYHCHVGFNLTNNTFRNDGFTGHPDSGRARITERPEDMGKFKVPTLRNIALTAPYMHDGSLKTLEEVIDHYSRQDQEHPNADPIIRPLGLTPQERQDLLAFLRTLTDESFVNDTRFGPPE